MAAALSSEFHGHAKTLNIAPVYAPCSTTTPSFMAAGSVDSFFFSPEQDAQSQVAKKLATLKAGKCPRLSNGWGEVGDCLATAASGFKDYGWHCPWESMILMSMEDWGACSNVRIDCSQTQYKKVLDLYEDHMTDAKPPPEGNLHTVKYAHCCVKHNCEGGPMCDNAPWDMKQQNEAIKRNHGKDPCGPAGCERLYSAGISKQSPLTARTHLASIAVMTGAATAAGVAALLLLWAARCRAITYRTVALDDADLHQSEI